MTVCGKCRHALLGDGGVFCNIYSERIVDETVAERCPVFDPYGDARAASADTVNTSSPADVLVGVIERYLDRLGVPWWGPTALRIDSPVAKEFAAKWFAGELLLMGMP